MGKKGSSRKAPNATSGPQRSVTIREASTGKNQTNAKSLSTLEHIKNLAVWASRDAGIPSLGALFGHQLAAASESLGIPVDQSLFTCQRCESILHPGYNCTIRIETNKINLRRKGKKAMIQPRNNIVYTCHFCLHQNIKRGAPRNITPPKTKPRPKPIPRAHEPSSSTEPKTVHTVANTTPDPLGSINEPRGKMGIVEIRETKDDSVGSGPVTPLTKPSLTLLESKMKKRNRSGAKKPTTSAVNDEKSVNTSNKKRRKSWTSLKEIAEISDNDNGKCKRENQKTKRRFPLFINNGKFTLWTTVS